MTGRWGARLRATSLWVGWVLAALPVAASMQFGALEVGGNVQTQNIVRHSQADKLQFIQNRNTFHLRVDWNWLQDGKWIEKVNAPFLERSKFYLLYRGVYDGFYDMAPGGRQHGQTRFDDVVGGAVTDLSKKQRDGIKYENELREMYVEGKLKDLPVSFRVGRQQVVWGESDYFRVMDIWNPLDVRWHFQQEPWDNIRVPLWLAKGLWDIGDLWRLSDTYLEVVYNPFDFQAGIQAAFLPRPWALPFADPLRPGQVQLDPNTGLLLGPEFNLTGSYRKGDFHRNPQDASEVGTRLHFVTPQGVEMSANYLYGRGRGIGAAPPFGVKITGATLPWASTQLPLQPANRQFTDGQRTRRVAPVIVDATIVHPYVHIFGLTGKYLEEAVTETTFRFETAYAMGEPYQTMAADALVPVRYADGVDSGLTVPIGFTKRDVWSGMLGFDRPTWIRWLNESATWFLTGQFFWHYTTGNVRDLRGNSGAAEDPYFTPGGGLLGAGTQGIGRWVSGPYAGRTERLQNPNVKGNGDNVRRWESMFTLGATTFYRNNTLVPLLGTAWDPVNSNLELVWNLDFFATSDLILSLHQKYFMTYGSRLPSNDPWYAGGRFARRDETGVRLTYQF
jgi:hypothetical protein